MRPNKTEIDFLNRGWNRAGEWEMTKWSDLYAKVRSMRGESENVRHTDSTGVHLLPLQHPPLNWVSLTSSIYIDIVPMIYSGKEWTFAHDSENKGYYSGGGGGETVCTFINLESSIKQTSLQNKQPI